MPHRPVSATQASRCHAGLVSVTQTHWCHSGSSMACRCHTGLSMLRMNKDGVTCYAIKVCVITITYQRRHRHILSQPD